jgi:hypothetical protein
MENFEDLKILPLKITLFSDVRPFSVVKFCELFGGTYCIYPQFLVYQTEVSRPEDLLWVEHGGSIPPKRL